MKDKFYIELEFEFDEDDDNNEIFINWSTFKQDYLIKKERRPVNLDNFKNALLRHLHDFLHHDLGCQFKLTKMGGKRVQE